MKYVLVPANRWDWSAVLAGTAAVFGLLISSAVVAVVVAGSLQWGPTLAPVVDDGIPLAVLALGMLLSGRVAVDVAGDRGVLCAAGAAGLVAALGAAVSRSSEAHGDGIEPSQVVTATLVVLILTGGPAALIGRRRKRREVSRAAVTTDANTRPPDSPDASGA